MLDSLASARLQPSQPSAEEETERSGPSLTARNWSGRSLSLITAAKWFFQTLHPSCTVEKGRLVWSADAPVELGELNQQGIKEMTISLAETFLPGGHFIRALRSVTPWLIEGAVMVGMGLLPTAAATGTIDVSDAGKRETLDEDVKLTDFRSVHEADTENC